MEVRKVAVISQNVKFEGTTDDAKYTVSGNVNIYQGKTQSVDTGEVVYQGTTVATFSQYGEGSNSVSFNNVGTTAQKVEIITAVDDFMAAAEEEIKNEE